MKMPAKQMYILVCMTWVAIASHSNTIANSTNTILCAGNPCNVSIEQTTKTTIDSSVSKNSNYILDQIQGVDVLIWITVALIAAICCLCGSFMCVCALQHTFEKDLTKARSISQTSMERQISPTMSSRHSNKWRSDSSNPSPRSQVALQPPSLHPSHSYSPSLRPVTLHVQDDARMPKGTALTRSKSATHLNANRMKQGVHRLYNSADSFTYGDSASTGASPRSFKERRVSDVLSNSNETSTMPSLPSLPTTMTGYDIENPQTFTAHIHPKGLPKKHVQQEEESANRNVSVSPRVLIYNQQPHTPVSCTPVAVTVAVPPPPPIILTHAHTHIVVPQPHVVGYSKDRIYHNLQHAMNTLAGDDPPHVTRGRERAWTDTSLGAQSVVPLKHEMSNGIVGMLGGGMFGSGNNDGLDEQVD